MSAGNWKSAEAGVTVGCGLSNMGLGMRLCALEEQSILLTDEHLSMPQRNS